MSYFLGTAPVSGPPGPLRVPGTALGHGCACHGVGDDSVTAAGEMTKIIAISAVALGALWYMGKRRAR